MFMTIYYDVFFSWECSNPASIPKYQVWSSDSQGCGISWMIPTHGTGTLENSKHVKLRWARWTLSNLELHFQNWLFDPKARSPPWMYILLKKVGISIFPAIFVWRVYVSKVFIPKYNGPVWFVLSQSRERPWIFLDNALKKPCGIYRVWSQRF